MSYNRATLVLGEKNTLQELHFLATTISSRSSRATRSSRVTRTSRPSWRRSRSNLRSLLSTAKQECSHACGGTLKMVSDVQSFKNFELIFMLENKPWRSFQIFNISKQFFFACGVTFLMVSDWFSKKSVHDMLIWYNFQRRGINEVCSPQLCFDIDDLVHSWCRSFLLQSWHCGEETIKTICVFFLFCQFIETIEKQ